MLVSQAPIMGSQMAATSPVQEEVGGEHYKTEVIMSPI